MVQEKTMIVQERTKDDNNHVSEYVLIFILGVRVPYGVTKRTFSHPKWSFFVKGLLVLDEEPVMYYLYKKQRNLRVSGVPFYHKAVWFHPTSSPAFHHVRARASRSSSK